MNTQFAIGRKVRWAFGPIKGHIGVVVAATTMDWGSASLVVLMPDGSYQHVNLKAPSVDLNSPGDTQPSGVIA